MNKIPSISIPVGPSAVSAGECTKSVNARTPRDLQRAASVRARQSGKLHSRFAGYMAFGAAVFVSLMAAATVASHDVPLLLGGF